mmetsp:Transcript_13657/g.32350  ORF Transcript_13657/g.32350 Transcript_13657/m.32350 type:complete len:334 (+) Transcript_13657:199-1200(+)|eukprot:CAMPEP_0172651074 /NCGR_PEP_ID=MMETSP1068-20121228/242620_1 /TAXON_ID=35684 /ORGANISM="Pseudopedinella elastica, Strain CCMP716" /LENGTH=333 /DNA_ID=CAMNT_0013465455 /DNA_START=97 /DNA_END=1098 /DNA_ORIENTATION=-
MRATWLLTAFVLSDPALALVQWSRQVHSSFSGRRAGISLLEEDRKNLMPTFPDRKELARVAAAAGHGRHVFALPFSSGPSCRTFGISVFDELDEGYGQVQAPTDSAAIAAAGIWGTFLCEEGLERSPLSISCGGDNLTALPGPSAEEVHVSGYQVRSAADLVEDGELRETLDSILGGGMEYCALSKAEKFKKGPAGRTMLVELSKTLDDLDLGGVASFVGETGLEMAVLTSIAGEGTECEVVDSVVVRAGNPKAPSGAHKCLAPHWAVRLGRLSLRPDDDQQGHEGSKEGVPGMWTAIRQRDSSAEGELPGVLSYSTAIVEGGVSVIFRATCE